MTDIEIKSLADKILDCIDLMEYGTVGRVASILQQLGYERINELDKLDIDEYVEKGAVERGYIIDRSMHNGKAEGWPHNLSFAKRKMEE